MGSSILICLVYLSGASRIQIIWLICSGEMMSMECELYSKFLLAVGPVFGFPYKTFFVLVGQHTTKNGKVNGSFSFREKILHSGIRKVFL